ncbi:PHD finger domain protein [Aspergillus sclerotialis]|uniref:PHD finger domain protein n=1 Tax=Aspergillus sclerotialis TaxID=2070753 RepID=A0A3A2ZHJ0_9EURO|nr:PHD finger domain protein [Aspergillus sclerotialis]
MPPKLRSGSSVKSHKTTSQIAPSVTESPSISKISRPMAPRKRQSTRAVTNTGSARTTRSADAANSRASPAREADRPESLVAQSDYHEPRMRVEAPSYSDTPWCGTSQPTNSYLRTMKPLGSTPSDADLGPAKKKMKKTADQVQTDETAAVAAAAEADAAEVDAAATPVLDFDQLLADMVALPLPTSTDLNVDEIKAGLEEVLALAVETKNVAVAKGLLRLWELSSEDPFVLHILNSVLQDEVGPHEMTAFQLLVNAAWSEIRIKEANSVSAANTNKVRRRSHSTTSSLSSAKSLDVETFAPEIVPGQDDGAKNGEESTRNTREEKNSDHPDGLAETTGSQKHPREDDTEEEIAAKRRRLQKSLPEIVVLESNVRSSTASHTTSPTNSVRSSPAPENTRKRTKETGEVQGSRKRRRISAKDKAKEKQSDPDSDAASKTDSDYHDDSCHECGGAGDLILCDDCPRSFHFLCVDPPILSKQPPAGEWLCPRCRASRLMSQYTDKLNKMSRKDFALPVKLRNHFTDARSGERGAYEDTAPIPRFTGRPPRGTRTADYDDETLLRTYERVNGVERPILCFNCGRAADGVRPTIACDYCPLSFHLDCLDPPKARPPFQVGNSERSRQNWMCPNHSYNSLFWFSRDEEGKGVSGRIRRPRNPRIIDVDVLPDEEEVEREANNTDDGILYRVRESGLVGDFVEMSKRFVFSFHPIHFITRRYLTSTSENYHTALEKEYAERYFNYTKSKYDEIFNKAVAYYSSLNKSTTIESEPAAQTIANSRSTPDREAVANLVAFAQQSTSSASDDLATTEQPEQSNNINLLVDQLKASAPDFPHPEDELTALTNLEKLVKGRIHALKIHIRDENANVRIRQDPVNHGDNDDVQDGNAGRDEGA